jgi:hypothetical protein
MHSVLLVCNSYAWVYSQSIQNDHIIITYRHSMLIFIPIKFKKFYLK